MSDARNTWLAEFDRAAGQTSALPTRRPLVIDRVRELRAAIATLRAGDPVPKATAEWLAAGLERFLQEGGRLDAHLGLKPRRGGSHETVRAVNRARERDTQLVIAIVRTPGDTVHAKVRALHRYLTEGGDPPYQGAEALRRFFVQGGARLPGARRMAQIFNLEPGQAAHLRV